VDSFERFKSVLKTHLFKLALDMYSLILMVILFFTLSINNISKYQLLCAFDHICMEKVCYKFLIVIIIFIIIIIIIIIQRPGPQADIQAARE